MRFRTGTFRLGGSREHQKAFDDDLDALLRATPFVAFGVGIRKSAFADFMASGTDPYLPTDVYAIAIQLLLERYVDYLAMSARDEPMGRLKFESQGATEDAHHARDYVAALVDENPVIVAVASVNGLKQGRGSSRRLRAASKSLKMARSGRLRMGPERLHDGTQAVGAVLREDLLSRRPPDGPLRPEGVPGLGHP